MKNKYILYFCAVILIIIIITLYILEIPAPSTTVIEEINLNIK